MSVQNNYFSPLWPLLAALGAGLIPEKPSAPPRSSLGAWPALGGLCLALGASLLISRVCLNYPSRASAPNAWDRETSLSPDDPWLLFHAGRRFLVEGQPQEALPLLRKAALKQPDMRNHLLYLAWAHAQLGRPAALMAWRQEKNRSLEASLLEFTANIWQAAVLLRQQPTQALARLKEVLRMTPFQPLVRGPHGPAEKDALQRLKTTETSGLLGWLDAILDVVPAETRLRLMEELASLAEPPLKVDLLRRVATLNLEIGNRSQSREMLLKAQRLPLNRWQRLRLAQAFRDIHDAPSAQRVLTPLLRENPSTDAWIELADVLMLRGNVQEALAALGKASASENPEDLHLVALAYQRMGRPRQSVALLEKLTRARPFDVVIRSDLGLCRYLSGDLEEAIRDLKLALRLNPRHWSAALTLGAIYSKSGLFQEADKVYQTALAQPPPVYPDAAWSLLRSTFPPSRSASESRKMRQTDAE